MQRQEPYEDVHALLLGWEYDETDRGGNGAMRDGLLTLESRLKDFLAYSTYSTWRIPYEESTDALSDHLRAFRKKYDSEDNLLVIYYCGHGVMDGSRNLLWTPRKHDRGTKTLPYRIPWNSLQTVFLNSVVADVLIIIDCCNALGAVMASKTMHPGNVVLWAACSTGVDTPLSGTVTFTHNLVAELQDIDERGKYVEDIHTSVLIRMDHQQTLSGLYKRSVPHCLRLNVSERRNGIKIKRLIRAEQDLDVGKPDVSEPDVSQPLVSAPVVAKDQGIKEEVAEQARPHEPPSTPSKEVSAGKNPMSSKPEISKFMMPGPKVYIPAESSRHAELLNLLSYKELTQREQIIARSMSGSYQWLSKEPNFGRWMTGSHSLFWITGKPGSGKSTLMAYISDSIQLLENLAVRANSRRTRIISHFFWAAGTELQKSFEGFLRALLFGIVSKFPEASDFLLSDVDSTEPLHLSQLLSRRSFERLFSHYQSPARDTKRFVIIDGLDECSVDSDEMLMFVTYLSSLPNIKICVSSRPWHSFVVAFEDAPQVRMQDLTAGDIAAYVDYRLNERNVGKSANIIDELKIQITRRAEGVFLWVVLIVRQMDLMMRDYASTADLLRALEELPVDLEALYRRFLDDATHGTAEILAIVFASEVEVYDNESAANRQPLLTTTSLYLASKMTVQQILAARIQPVDLKETIRMAEAMTLVLDDTVGGLLVAEPRSVNEALFIEDGNLISYSHKTARDFLADDHVRRDFLKNHVVANPRLALLGASVAQIKQSHFGVPQQINLNELGMLRCWAFIEQGIRHAHEAILHHPDDTILLLDELDRVMTYQMNICLGGSLGRHWSSFLPLGNSAPKNAGDNFLSYAASCGLHQYIKYKLDNGFCTTRKPGRPLLDYAVDPQQQFRMYPDSFATVELLVRHGADVNQRYESETIYERFLRGYEMYGAEHRSDVFARELRKTYQLLSGKYIRSVDLG